MGLYDRICDFTGDLINVRAFRRNAENLVKPALRYLGQNFRIHDNVMRKKNRNFAIGFTVFTMLPAQLLFGSPALVFALLQWSIRNAERYGKPEITNAFFAPPKAYKPPSTSARRASEGGSGVFSALHGRKVLLQAT
jgi:hypothetical protein